MSSHHSHLTRHLRHGVLAVALAGLAVGTASAQERIASNTQTLGADGSSAGERSATAVGRYTGADGQSSADSSAVRIENNAQGARYVGNAATTRVDAAMVSTGDDAHAVVQNDQDAAATLAAASIMTMAEPRAMTDTILSLSSNANSAAARMNDAVNGVSDETQDGAIATVLQNGQRAKGTITASTVTVVNIGSDDASIANTRISFDGNSLVSDASANQAVNSVTATALTSAPKQTVLDSTQTSQSAVLATAESTAELKGGNVWRSALTISDNSANAVARGNLVRNTVAIQGGATGGSDSCEEAQTSSRGVSAVLDSRQVNSGPVQSKAVFSASGPLNGGTVTDSRIAMTGNVVSAASYGNVGQNSAILEGGSAPMTMTNRQTNTGPVSAEVVGLYTMASPSGSFYSASGIVSGNTLAASAFGNHANSVVSASR